MVQLAQNPRTLFINTYIGVDELWYHFCSLFVYICLYVFVYLVWCCRMSGLIMIIQLALLAGC